MNDILITLALVGASIGLAYNVYLLASGKDDIPRKSCGVKPHWCKMGLILVAKFIINAFVGILFGWIALTLFHWDNVISMGIAGVAGGQGTKLFELIMDKFYNRADKELEEVGL